MGGLRPFRFGVIHEQPQPAATWGPHLRRIEDLGFSTFLIRDHVSLMEWPRSWPDWRGDDQREHGHAGDRRREVTRRTLTWTRGGLSA
jgi:hypothetical protein